MTDRETDRMTDIHNDGQRARDMKGDVKRKRHKGICKKERVTDSKFNLHYELKFS